MVTRLLKTILELQGVESEIDQEVRSETKRETDKRMGTEVISG